VRRANDQSNQRSPMPWFSGGTSASLGPHSMRKAVASQPDLPRSRKSGEHSAARTGQIARCNDCARAARARGAARGRILAKARRVRAGASRIWRASSALFRSQRLRSSNLSARHRTNGEVPTSLPY